MRGARRAASRVVPDRGRVDGDAAAGAAALKGILGMRSSLVSLICLKVSLLSSGSLDATQPCDFRLTSVGFVGIAAGTAAFVLTQTDIGNAGGAPLPAESPEGLALEVPEPRAWVLLLWSLSWVARRRPRLL